MTPASRTRLRTAGVTVGSALIIIAATWCIAVAGEGEVAIAALGTFLVGGLIVAGTLRLTASAELPAMPPVGQADAWDLTLRWCVEHGAVPALIVLTTVVGVMYSHIFHGETVGDDLTFHMAESARIADCIRHGDWDFWNPSANAGFASAYYYQVLPQLASALPTALFGHHLFWFQVSLWLPLVIAPLAAYRGMRMLGASPWQALFAAFAVVYLSGQSRWGTGADGTFQVGLYTQTWALAVFPLGLGHGVRYLTEGKGLAPAIAWGAFVFLCHPFASIALCLGLAVGVLAHYCAFPVRTPAIKIVLLVLVGGAFAANSVALSLDPRIMYLAPLVFFAGLLVRITTRGRLMTALLLAGVALAFLANTVALGIEVKRLYIVPLVLLAAIAGRLVIDLIRPSAPEPAGPPPDFYGPLIRLCILGAALLVATSPGWLPVILDRDGFGGFPHRVKDEIGPGYRDLMIWYGGGKILDYGRLTILTWTLPIVIVFARARFMRWLWAPTLVYATLLALGPHAPTTADDLLPAVRFLGAMQVVLGLAIGAGGFAIGRALWEMPPTHPLHRLVRAVIHRADSELQYGIRTGLIALAAGLLLFLGLSGTRQLAARVNVLPDYDYRDEMMEVIDVIQHQPPGRKQVGPGCENHWWNLLSYVYAKRPSLLQMGGGGLQASPNYDFLWSVRDFPKLAWVYDTPLFVFARTNSATAPEGETLLQTNRYELRRLPAPGIVSPVQVTGVLPAGESRAGSPVRIAAINWLKSDLPLSDHVLAYDGYGTAGQAPDAKVIRAFRVDPSPGDSADIYAEVEVTQRSTFMARESWHPRWHAYVDGIEVPIRRVTPDFPAIDVAPGKHVLAFRFERPWWAQAAWLAWPGVSLAAWLITWLLRRLRARGLLPQARVIT
jgi:hypothetical protein